MALGTAITNQFLLGTATVMIGAQASVFELDPTNDAIGLVKNFSCTSTPTYTDLTQGVLNSRVASVMTGIDVKASMEVFEYTARNLTYGLGLDGSTVTAQTIVTTLSAAVAGSKTTPVTTVDVTSATSLAANDWIMIIDGQNGNVAVTQIQSISTNVLTVAPGIGQALASGATVQLVNMVDVGSYQTQPYLSAKVVGALANGQIATLLLPKIRIVKGFTLAFQTNAFGNLPYEFELYDLVASDPLYSEFPNKKAALFIQ